MKADGTKKLDEGKEKPKGEEMHRQSAEKEKKHTGSVYRRARSSTIYTASFKTQMSFTIFQLIT